MLCTIAQCWSLILVDPVRLWMNLNFGLLQCKMHVTPHVRRFWWSISSLHEKDAWAGIVHLITTDTSMLTCPSCAYWSWPEIAGAEVSIWDSECYLISVVVIVALIHSTSCHPPFHLRYNRKFWLSPLAPDPTLVNISGYHVEHILSKCSCHITYTDIHWHNAAVVWNYACTKTSFFVVKRMSGGS